MAAWWVFAFGALAEVVSAGPERILNGLGGKLMKGLAKELGMRTRSGLGLHTIKPDPSFHDFLTGCLTLKELTQYSSSQECASGLQF